MNNYQKIFLLGCLTFLKFANAQALEGRYSIVCDEHFCTYYSFFVDGSFEYHEEGFSSEDICGKGKYIVDKLKVILNFYEDINNYSTYYRESTYRNAKEFILVSFQFKTIEGAPINYVYASVKDHEIDPNKINNGHATLKLPKEKGESVVAVRGLGLRRVEFKIDNTLNYNIEVFLADDRTCTPIKDEIIILELKDIKKSKGIKYFPHKYR